MKPRGKPHKATQWPCGRCARDVARRPPTPVCAAIRPLKTHAGCDAWTGKLSMHGNRKGRDVVMFQNHQPEIGAWARRHPQNFAATGAFVICTIRVPLERAILEYRAYRDHGDVAGLWGWKLAAVQELEANAAERLARLESLRLGRAEDRNAMLAEVASWTGFGFVKGGFLLQLAFGMSGCIDSQNERRLGVDMRAEGFAHGPRTARKRHQKARRYHKLVDNAGGTEKLWDDWCRHIAEARPDVWSDAYEVSRHHALSVLPPGELNNGFVGEDIPL